MQRHTNTQHAQKKQMVQGIRKPVFFTLGNANPLKPPEASRPQRVLSQWRAYWHTYSSFKFLFSSLVVFLCLYLDFLFKSVHSF